MASHSALHDQKIDKPATKFDAPNEHYEISRYRTLKMWASELGIDGAVKLLDATLQEEKKTDTALTQLAVTIINYEAEAA